jgi:type II secretory pathway pseudopilin PulG
MVEIIVGVILIGIGAGLILSSSASKGKAEAMESTETSSVDFLNSLAQSMSEGVGSGTLSYACEVKGKVVCSQPLVSELAQVKCVYYSMRVDRQYEETYYEEDKQGHRERKTRTQYETVASNTRSVSFDVEDGTGNIKINPGNAEFVTEKVLSRFETGASAGKKRLSVGSFTLNVSDYPRGGDRRTIGYRFEEQAIPTGRNVYILGEANDRDGQLSISVPKDGGKLIISVKGEEELLRNEKSSAKMKLIGAVVCAVLGVAAILLGIFY